MAGAPISQQLKDDIGSIERCKQETIRLLENFLGQSGSLPPSKPAGVSAGRDGTAQKRTALKEKPPKASKRSAITTALPENERLKLATEVVNTSLKAFTEVLRIQSQGKLKSHSKSTTTNPSSENNLENVASCARIGFAFLRRAHDAKASDQNYKIETGMSAFIGKLIGLKLFDAAVLELRILAQRLMNSGAGEKGRSRLSKTQHLSQLLDLEHLPSDKQGLSLLVVSQIHSLKLIAHSEFSESQAALKAMQAKKPAGPLQLITRCYADGHMTVTEAGKNFRNLSQSLAEFGDKTAIHHKAPVETKAALSAKLVLNAQLLSLTTVLHGNRVLGHETDFANEILIPLGKHIRAFSRESSGMQKTPELDLMTLVGEIDQNGIDRALSTFTKGEHVKHAIRAKSALVLLAGSCARPIDVEQYFRGATRHLDRSALSSLQKRQIYCELCLDGQEAGVSIKLLEPCLTKLAALLVSSMESMPQELDDTLVTSSSLRRRIMERLRIKSNASGHNQNEEYSEIMDTYFPILSSIAHFTLQYLHGSQRETNSIDETRRHQCSSMVNRIARPTIDSVLMLLRIAVVAGNHKESFSSPLKVCAALVAGLDTAVHEGTLSALDERLSGIHVKLSDQLFQYFQASRIHVQPTTDMLAMLQLSIDVLSKASVQEQAEGRYAEKLCRLARAYDAAGLPEKTFETLQWLMRLCEANGALIRAIPNYKCSPVPAEGVGQDGPDVVQLMASTFVRVAKMAGMETLSTLFTSTIGKQDPITCGYLAECEMAATTSILHTVGSTNADCMKAASEAMTRWYARKRHPVRRLRVMTWVLQTGRFWPQRTDSELVAVCEKELEDFDLQDTAEDSQLVDQVPLLLSLAHISIACSGDRFQLQVVRCALDSWSRALGDSGKKLLLDLSKLLSVWPQIVSLTNYLCAHNLWHEYSAALRVLDLLCKYGVSDGQDVNGAILIRTAQAKLQLGQLHECHKLLETSAPIIDKSSGILKAFAGSVNASLCLEYGNPQESLAKIEDARTFLAAAEIIPVATGSSGLHPGHSLTAAILLGTIADHHQSLGSSSRALFFARASAKVATSTWRAVLKQAKAKASLDRDDKQDRSITEEFSETKRSTANEDLAAVAVTANNLLPTAVELITSLTRLSRRLADSGVIQEARQYLRQAEKIADGLKLKQYSRRLSIISAGFSILEGRFEDGTKELEDIIGRLEKKDLLRVEAEIELCKALWLAGHAETAKTQLSKIAIGLESLEKAVSDTQDRNPVALLEQDMRQLKIGKTRAVASSHVKPSKTAKAPLKGPVHKVVHTAPNDGSNVRQKRLSTQMRILQISMNLPEHEFSSMWTILDQLRSSDQTTEDKIMIEALKSRLYFEEAMETLALDPIYNSLHDAPLAFPAKVSKITLKAVGTEVRIPSTRQKRAPVKPGVKKVPAKTPAPSSTMMPQQSLHALEQSSRCMSDIIPLAQSGASTYVVHDIAYNLAKVSMFLSATETTGSLEDFSCTLAGAIEIGRGSAALRQAQMAAAEEALLVHDEKSLVDPRFDEDNIAALSLSLPENFQEHYVDILPPTWTVISLSLSNDGRELQISRLRKGATPFVLVLPLGRNFDGMDENDLKFETAKEEMADIVKLANFSAHDTTNLSKKGAKTEWWNTRNALDDRLEVLLESMDKTWLGGFAGLFTQREIVQKPFAAFVGRFLGILDKHLPSRTQRTGSTKREQVKIDQNVMEIFVGLGLPTEEGDLDEALLDLFAFVVDILQFNGERNAFDEIDFDAMVLDTLDALTQYHQAAERQIPSAQDDSHLILVLDKHLHCFPWESLPCMQGASVSRLPSLEMLRQRITAERQDHGWDAEQSILAVDREDGACVLNPAGDLIHTEKVFSEPLGKLPDTWSKVIRREPEETELANLLASRSLYVYLGHGSGGQYIRSRTIRKLKDCAVSLLLGCSSATVTEAGQFESYGTPLTYLQGGAPAVVGTLWDVTDKDIDRFSLKMLQRWGLFDETVEAVDGSFKTVAAPKAVRGKKKAPKQSPQRQPSIALDRAVAEARGECLMRYLNGAAPVVYGVPVILR